MTATIPGQAHSGADHRDDSGLSGPPPGEDHVPSDHQTRIVLAGNPYDHLRLWAEAFADVQQTRLSVENRLRAANTRDDAISPMSGYLRRAETATAKELRTWLRIANPALSAWAKETVGIGEHSLGRLLGVIGDPAVARPYHWEGAGEDRVLVADPPYLRTLAQLRSYCGVGDPARRRRKGMTADEAAATGSPRAKTALWNMAVAASRQTGTPPTEDVPIEGAATSTDPARPRSPYRGVYDAARARYEDREDWTKGHKHAAALRAVMKAILADVHSVAVCAHREAEMVGPECAQVAS